MRAFARVAPASPPPMTAILIDDVVVMLSVKLINTMRDKTKG